MKTGIIAGCATMVAAASLAVAYTLKQQQYRREDAHRAEDEARATRRASRPDTFRSFDIKVISGSAHPAMAKAIAKRLGNGASQMKVTLGKFANGETRVELKEGCRGCDVYIINPICPKKDIEGTDVLSINDIWMETLIMVSALRGASAGRVTVVMPLCAYPRQDKKERSRIAIGARFAATLLQTAGIDRCVCVDLHSAQIQGFYSKPMDHLYAEDHLLQAIHTMAQDRPEDFVVVSPHPSGAKRATRIANKLGMDCAVISKVSFKDDRSTKYHLVGNVDQKIIILVDDLADTLTTLLAATTVLMANGAKYVHAYAIHGVLSEPAIDRLNACEALHSLTVTNSIPQDINTQRSNKIEVVDISIFVADAIQRLHDGRSLDKMYKKS